MNSLFSSFSHLRHFPGIIVAKTIPKRKTVSPDWNQTFSLGPLSHGHNIVVEVWDYDAIGYGRFLKDLCSFALLSLNILSD